MRPHIVLIALLVLALSGCKVSGKPFEYFDLKFIGSPVTTPTQPPTNQSVGVSFKLFNTDTVRSIDNVTWRVYQDSPDPAVPTAGTPIATGTVSIGAGAFLPQSFSIPATAAGTHTYATVIDPDNSIVERVESDNVQTLSLTFSDLDISFAATPTFASSLLDVSSNITMTYSLLNTPTVGGPAPAANVTYRIFEGATEIFPVSASVANPVAVVSGATVPITVVIPSTVGPHHYTVVLTSDVLESNQSNSTSIVTIHVGAAG